MGDLVAYRSDVGGGRHEVIHVLSLDPQRVANDTLPTDNDESSIAWVPPYDRFVYRRLDADVERPTGTTCFVHRVGDAGPDLAVFGSGVLPAFGADDVPDVRYVPGQRFVIATTNYGVRHDQSVYVKAVDALEQAATPWLQLATQDDLVQDVTAFGDRVLAVSYRRNPRGEILSFDPSTARSAATPVTLVAGRDRVIKRVVGVSDWFVYAELEAGFTRLHVVRHGRDVTVALPFEGLVTGITPDPMGNRAVFRIESPIHSARWLAVTADGSTAVVVELRVRTKDWDDYEITHLSVPSAGGVEVPVTYVSKKGTTKSRAAWLIGYGAYGNVLLTNFAAERKPWLDAGGAIAFAHVRGGGEYGEPWHEAGRGRNKEAGIADFNAVAEFPISTGRVEKGRIACTAEVRGEYSWRGHSCDVRTSTRRRSSTSAWSTSCVARHARRGA